jgi:hypothetical protein
LKLIFCLIQQLKGGNRPERRNDTWQHTSAGLLALAALYPIIEVAINVSPEACKHMNMICITSFVFQDLFLLSIKAKGVAAESSPRN